MMKINFKSVFDEAMSKGVNFWDAAYAYDAGTSETILGDLMADTPRENLVISTKFTPQMEDATPNAMSNMLEGSLERLKTYYIDYYWIHNDADVEKWTSQIIPLIKSGKI